MNRRIATIIGLAVAILLAVATLAPSAQAKPTPRLTSEPAASECWGKGRTLIHTIVRNHGDKSGKYRVTVTRSNGKVQTWAGRVGKDGQGVLEGFVVRKGETVPEVTITTVDDNAWVIYWRTDTRSAPRCEKRH